MESVARGIGRDEIFISYSHDDEIWLGRLKDQIEPMIRSGAVRAWDDTFIRPGDRWLDKITEALARARVAVLLVSPSFLKSPFIAHQELPPILKAAKDDGLRIFWIHVVASIFERSKLAEYQAAGNVKRPLAGLRKAARDDALAQIGRQLLEAYEEAVPPQTTKSSASPSRDDLLARLDGIDDLGIVGDVLAGRWGLGDVRASLTGDEGRARELIQSVAQGDGGTWARMLAAYGASVAPPDPQELARVALREDLLWRQRRFVISCVRFTPPSERGRAADALAVHGKWSGRTGYDPLRLMLRGLGFLGSDVGILWALRKEGFFEYDDAAEKLADYGVAALLQSSLSSPDDRGRERALRSFESLYEDMEKQNRLDLDAYVYLDELQCLRPGLAAAPFRLFRDRRWALPMTGLLFALGRRPNRILLEEVLTLGASSDDYDVAAASHRAAAHVGVEAAVDGLSQAMAAGHDGAGPAYLLSIGVAHDLTRAADLLEVLNDPTPRRWPDLNDGWHSALWALGELGRSDPGLVKPVCVPMTHAPQPLARGLAWLALAKAGELPGRTEVEQAFDVASEFLERVLVATAAGLGGHRDILLEGMRAAIDNHAPLYRMAPHMERDVRAALVSSGGTDLCTLLEVGAFG